MAQVGTPQFSNDIGAEKIEIGVKKFKCIGAQSPFDHPHVALDMGQETQIVCPYCSTLFQHSSDLAQTQTRPAGCNVPTTATSA